MSERFGWEPRGSTTSEPYNNRQAEAVHDGHRC